MKKFLVIGLLAAGVAMAGAGKMEVGGEHMVDATKGEKMPKKMAKMMAEGFMVEGCHTDADCKKIEEALSKMKGVSGFHMSDMKSGSCTVMMDSKMKPAMVEKAIAKLGYKAKYMPTEPMKDGMMKKEEMKGHSHDGHGHGGHK